MRCFRHYEMATVNIIGRGRTGEFETESAPLLEEVEGRWQTTDRNRSQEVVEWPRNCVRVCRTRNHDHKYPPMPIIIGARLEAD